MAGFKLSEALIGRMADGMGVRPGSAMLQGIQQGQQQVQQRTDNRNAAELLSMKKAEFKMKSDTYRQQTENERGRIEAMSERNKPKWIAHGGNPSEFDQIGTLDEQNTEQDDRIRDEVSTYVETYKDGQVFQQGMNKFGEPVGDAYQKPLDESERFSNSEYGTMDYRGPAEDSEGNFIGGIFTTPAGQMFVMEPGSEEIRPMQEGEKSTTNSAMANVNQRADKFYETATKVTLDEIRFQKLERYMKSVKGREQGIEGWVDDFKSSMTTLFGGAITDKAQWNSMVASGQVQGILGAFRTEVVGPGVMTEYDALRVLNAIGGDVDIWQNKQRVAQLIGDVLMDGYKVYSEVNLPAYNAQSSRYAGFEAKAGYEMDTSLFTTGFEGPSVGSITNDSETGIDWEYTGGDPTLPESYRKVEK